MPKKSAWIAIRNVGWAGVEALTSVLVSLIAMLGIARMVGAAEFGLGALALGITQILTVVLGSLFHDALVRNPGLERRHFDSAFTATVLLSLIAFLICLALAQPLAIFFKEPRFTLVFIVMAVGLIPEAAGATLVAERRRELDFRLVTLHFMAARGFGAIAGVICAVAGLGVWSLVVQQYVTTVLALIVLLIFGSHRPRFRLVIADLIPMVRFTCSIIATQFVIQFSQRLMLIYVARVGDLTLAGYWGLADRLVDALQRTITNALYHVSLSHFSKVQDNHERLGVLVRQANVWLASLVFPGLALLAVVGPEVIDFLLGEAWLPAGVAVQVLAIGVIIQLRRLMDHVALNALGYSEVAFVAYLFEAVLAILALFVFGPTTLFGIALVRAAQPLAGYLLIALKSIRRTGRSPWQEALEVGRDVVLTLLVGLAVWWLYPHLWMIGPFAVLIVCGATAVAVAIAATALLRPYLVLSLWSLLRARMAGSALP